MSCYTWPVILFLSSVLAATASLAVSWVAEKSLTSPLTLIPGFLRLRLSHNPGIAFSIAIPSPWQEIIIVSALIAVCIFAMTSKPSRLGTIAFGLVIGGAVGNLIDRFGDGLVTDYVSVGTFPVFNAADSFITIGAGLLLLEGWLERPRKPKKA